MRYSKRAASDSIFFDKPVTAGRTHEYNCLQFCIFLPGLSQRGHGTQSYGHDTAKKHAGIAMLIRQYLSTGMYHHP
jgi:hypothetical protein